MTVFLVSFEMPKFLHPNIITCVISISQKVMQIIFCSPKWFELMVLLWVPGGEGGGEVCVCVEGVGEWGGVCVGAGGGALRNVCGSYIFWSICDRTLYVSTSSRCRYVENEYVVTNNEVTRHTTDKGRPEEGRGGGWMEEGGPAIFLGLDNSVLVGLPFF